MTNRRDFLKGTAAGLGAAAMTPLAQAQTPSSNLSKQTSTQAKNIIFLLSDGMNMGTFSLAAHWLETRMDKSSAWLDLYRTLPTRRGLMDTASANSPVTDSAAAGSAWGCGQRVNNRAINVSVAGKELEPIWVTAKKKGKRTGLVTTTRLTHATPASFAANVVHRNMEDEIALQYLDREIDILLGGGMKHFHAFTRRDHRDLQNEFRTVGYQILHNRSQLRALQAEHKKVLGLFAQSHLPYTIDLNNNERLQTWIPSLSEMTATALSQLENKEGFVLQIEAGRVDHAGHANDAAAILWDQIAFEETVALVATYVEKNPDTLFILTTDHGTGGVQFNGMGSGYVDSGKVLDNLAGFSQSLEGMENALKEANDEKAILSILAKGTGLQLKTEEVSEIATALLNPANRASKASLPHLYGKLVQPHTSVGFTSTDHTGDYVECAAWGPGSEALKPFFLNTDLHSIMLKAL